jgi:CheY-like chemotaxis protein
MEVIMTKIMLVEDDKSLREIYGVRLLAEGYDITSAGDGEEALAMAVKERPDLILSDVMMPKISGFDMLDILRSTPETKDIKVIMMTALSSDDQRDRGEKLGADRYLVKSQVGIEDVVRTVHELLADTPTAAPAAYNFGVPVQTAAIQTEEPTDQPDDNAAAPETAESVIAAPAMQQPAPVPEPELAPTPSLDNGDEVVAAAAPMPDPTPEPVTTIAEPPFTPVVEAPQPDLPTIDNPTDLAPETPVMQPEEPVSPIVAPEPPAEPIAPTTTVEAEPVEPVEPVIAEPVIQPPEPTPAPIAPIAPAAPSAPSELPRPTAPFASPAPASLGDRVINPVTPATPPSDISYMMEKELSEDSAPTDTAPPAEPQV